MPGSLSRLLSPKSVAVVGASEGRTMSDVAMSHLRDAPIDLHLVNPSLSHAYGRATVARLGEIKQPVDAVLCLVGAERAVTVVEEASALDCGGVVVVASGFAEAGPQGHALHSRLVNAAGAGGLPVVGPNCTGFSNALEGVSLFTGTPVGVRPGRISLVSSSGYLMRAAMVAARERNLGMRLAVSAGNEAVTSLTDYMEFLVDDPETGLIAVVTEKIHDPVAFFAAAARAREAGKPVVVLKLGRSERARDIVRSHTGALTGEGWVYDVAFRSRGILDARDLDEMMDGLAILAQLPRARWRAVKRIAVLASSGGVAALASDTLSDEVVIPPLDGLRGKIQQLIPGANVVNPLDLTGFTITDPRTLESVLQAYQDCDDVDAVVICWWLGPDDERRAALLLDPARAVAEGGTTPTVLATVEDSPIGTWTSEAGGRGVVFGRGLRGTVRGLRGMDRFVSTKPRLSVPAALPVSRPDAVVESEAGPILSFADGMRLLADHDVPVAPWTVLDDARDWDPEQVPGEEMVVKLADVPHRTDTGAVRIGVHPGDVPGAVAELAALAERNGLPRTVAVQARVTGAGEAFVGCQADTELGPVVVVGLGGVLVELTRGVVGRLLPVDDADIEAMLDELGRDTVFAGLRGGRAWDRKAMAAVVRAVADLATRADWLASIDLNPVICDENGCTVVDALVQTRS